MQLNTGSIAWPFMVLRLLLRHTRARKFPGREKELIQELGKLILEYLDEKEAKKSPNGAAGAAQNQINGKALIQCDVWKTIENMIFHTSMWVVGEEYYSVVDLLNGYDTSSGRLDLDEGFRGWLLEKLGLGSSQAAWPELALMLLPGYDPHNTKKMFPGREKELIHGLGGLLLEYLDEREAAKQA
jgi:hypothetical protein